MHSPIDFADHCLGLLKNRGTTGPSGPIKNKSFNSNENVGTTGAHEVGPVNFEWSQACASSGPGKRIQNQQLTDGGTTGTTGTTNFKQPQPAAITSKIPSHWHAILEQLNRCEPVSWLSEDRWKELLTDTTVFLGRWSDAASALNWSALDLLGVHRLAPAGRFDSMGLILFIRGGSVAAMTETTATIHRHSGAILHYRREPLCDAVLLSEVKS